MLDCLHGFSSNLLVAVHENMHYDLRFDSYELSPHIHSLDVENAVKRWRAQRPSRQVPRQENAQHANYNLLPPRPRRYLQRRPHAARATDRNGQFVCLQPQARAFSVGLRPQSHRRRRLYHPYTRITMTHFTYQVTTFKPIDRGKDLTMNLLPFVQLSRSGNVDFYFWGCQSTHPALPLTEENHDVPTLPICLPVWYT